MKDAVATMGMLLPPEIDGRDAVHVAVIAVTCGARSLMPGQEIGVRRQRDGSYIPNFTTAAVGIVDPFLKEKIITSGQRFWLFLFPRTITGLSHRWTHPAFPEEAPPAVDLSQKERSETWLRDFADRSNCPEYEDLIAAAVGYHDDDYLHFSGQDAHGEIPDEFWLHVEIVTGRKISKRPKFFSCSC